MNEKLGFIRPGSSHPWSSLDVPGPTVGIYDDSWSTEAHEWDVCCTVPYPTVSTEMCVPKHLRLDLHCIGQSAEPLSGADFGFTKRDSLRRPFSLMMRGQQTPWRLLLVSPSFIHFA
ncbi:hypothetical protein AVEN_220561-1 [Araneus ventricosus]|uniref:Uncharacterized protein n=1 Tax=Araneus ventricosus TaxID=182803 RepID=A0A4Y2WV23_ARAVE|nr:hypothetical protein AVEN_250106-1 [Araneus ventricosus]GBO39947.1 hypothetical protein AVEN_63934-1 [Araneus ventricosus]GBO39952.1 hypothetical protein AVEN_209111-1 [Araneus ventricosus]GBO39953.1 hypothetical protein AVEN_220561-1 [Araneus ventricosus]